MNTNNYSFSSDFQSNDNASINTTHNETTPDYDENLDDHVDGDYTYSLDNDKQFMLTDPKSTFVAEFSDGYSFRNMIEYLRATNTKGNFFFSKDLIRYEQADASVTLLNQIEIQTCELTLYEFQSKTNEIIIGVNFNDMRAITKTIGKKDSVRLYKVEDNPSLHIQIINRDTRAAGRTNVSIVRHQQMDVIVYGFPEYKRDEKHPNCTVPTSDFTKMCTAMSSVKCSYVSVYGLPHGVVFKGMLEGSTFGRIERFGNHNGYTPQENYQNRGGDSLGGLYRSGSFDIDNIQSRSSGDYSSHFHDPSSYVLNIDNIILPSGPKPKLILKNNSDSTSKLSIKESSDHISEDESVKVKIKMYTIKSLAKLNNLSTMGIIKMYMENSNPLKLVCKIGTYGTLRIYIESADD